MTAPRRFARRRPGDRVSRLLGIFAVAATLVACAAAPPIDVPAELPLLTHDQGFEIRWALQRDAAIVRAVGRVKPTIDAESVMTLSFYGVGSDGRIVSTGTTYARSDFGRRPYPFAVTLTPTGREARFEVRVTQYYRSGNRSN
jgi:hypothetical protein